MKISEIENGFRKTIEQFFNLYNQPYYQGSEEERLYFIAGVLKSALHIIPLDNYYALKDYIYKTYGYDPGGAADQQMTLEEWEKIT